MLAIVFLFLFLQCANGYWQTLSGLRPTIVSRGDSGIFPDQTREAYAMGARNAEKTNIDGYAFLCDIQLCKDGTAICRTGLNLERSSNIDSVFANKSSHVFNGNVVTGIFSVDISFRQLVEQNVSARQQYLGRPRLIPADAATFDILTPAIVHSLTAPFPLWLNVEYSSFYSKLNLDIEEAIVALPPTTPISYLSSPDVGFLKAVKPRLPITTKLLLKFLEEDETEASTNQTYGSLLSDLSAIADYAYGILVPKSYIWPVDHKAGYLQEERGLIAEAHRANLAVFAYQFVNELVRPVVYNYSFNPVLEYLQFVPENAPNLDGFLTDFPITASQALGCYRGSVSSSVGEGDAAAAKKKKQVIIVSYNGGASGDYPGCTRMAYDAAIRGGAAYIDCPIQMTEDGIPICRQSPDLLTNTDISTRIAFFPSKIWKIPTLEPSIGIYSFNLTYNQIKTLKANADASDLSAFRVTNLLRVSRNQAFDGLQGIWTLSEFLDYAKKENAKVLLNIQVN